MRTYFSFVFGWILFSTAVARAQFTTSTNNGTITITGYTNSNPSVIVPVTLNSLPVTSIGNGAFQSSGNLITSVDIVAGVTNIGAQAFYDCSLLTGVTMPTNVTSIGNNAFDLCSHLTSAVIPPYVTNIGSAAFAGCTSLGNVTLPASVTAIADMTFYQSGVTNVSIPASVTSIGNYVFDGCTRLSSIVLPVSVTNIGSLSFLCYSLTNISMVSSNAFFSSLNGVLFNANQTTIASYPPGLVGSYTVPNGVTNLGYAFQYCTNLTSVTLPSGLTGISAGAFAYCSGLTNVNLPGTLRNIAQQAFSPSGLISITIPNGVTNIGQQAFGSCAHLTTITIPASVTNIGSYAFVYCYSLAAINVNAANPAYSSFGGVLFNNPATTLIAYPLGNGNGSYTVPGTVTNIASEAFAYAGNLTNVVLPATVANIGADAFYNLPALVAVYAQGNAPAIDAYDFALQSGGFPAATNYYLAGTAGWTTQFGGLTNVAWSLPYPIILDGNNGSSGFGVRSNQFSFTASWATNLTVIVQACTNLSNPSWQPLQTNTISGGYFTFSDSQWTNYHRRFYRLIAQ